MKLPFPIRGTEEWDNREFERFELGCNVMSFGSIDTESLSERWLPVKKRIRVELAERDVPKHIIEEFVSNRPR